MAAKVNDLPEAEQRAVLGSIGQAFYVLRDFDQAKVVYRELAKRSKDDLNIQLLLYSLMRNAQDEAGMQAAVDEIQRLAGENNSYTLYCKAARIVTEVQNKKRPLNALDDARALADKASAQRPNWGAAWRLRGEIDERLGNADKAIDAFLKAVDLGDTNPGMMRHLAQLLLQKQHPKRLRAIVDKLPNGPALLGPRITAVLDIIEGKVADAVPLAREAAKDDPDNYVTQLWLGDVYRTAGHFEEAEKAYKRAAELAPDVADCWISLARLYVTQDRRSDLQGVIEEIKTKVKPEYRELALATVQETAGNSKDSEADYLAALEKNPGDLRTLELVAAFYIRRNNLDKAKEYLNRLDEVGSRAPADQRALSSAPTARWPRSMLPAKSRKTWFAQSRSWTATRIPSYRMRTRALRRNSMCNSGISTRAWKPFG